MIDVPASASPHVARAITTARNLIAGATSANTRRSYETGWRQFTAHAQGLGLKGGMQGPETHTNCNESAVPQRIRRRRGRGCRTARGGRPPGR